VGAQLTSCPESKPAKGASCRKIAISQAVADDPLGSLKIRSQIVQPRSGESPFAERPPLLFGPPLSRAGQARVEGPGRASGSPRNAAFAFRGVRARVEGQTRQRQPIKLQPLNRGDRPGHPRVQQSVLADKGTAHEQPMLPFRDKLVTLVFSAADFSGARRRAAFIPYCGQRYNCPLWRPVRATTCSLTIPRQNSGWRVVHAVLAWKVLVVLQKEVWKVLVVIQRKVWIVWVVL
jgi:hypothetical protein